MANHNDFKKLTKDSILENLEAVKYCLQYQKSNNIEIWAGQSGVLGMPSLVLLCSVIDTMGSYFRLSDLEINTGGISKKIETSEGHFLILNQDKLFNLNLSDPIIKAFYSKYRSTATHNSTLPLNTLLELGDGNDSIFEIAGDELVKIRLKPLLKKVESAFEIFKNYLENATWSEDHWLTKDIVQTKANKTVLVESNDNATSYTQTNTSKGIEYDAN